MKRVAIHTLTHHGVLFDPNARDGIMDPYIFLRDTFRDAGVELCTLGDMSLENIDWVLFWDIDSAFPRSGVRGAIRAGMQILRGRSFRDVYGEARRRGTRMGVFLWEPPTTSSANWSPRLQSKFEVVYTWNDSLVDGRRFQKIHCPQTRHFPSIAPPPFTARKLLVNISANKASMHPRELYTARRRAIRYFETNHPADFDLYGAGWNNGKRALWRGARHYRSYRGTIANKWDVLPSYRFAICYENIEGEPGYVTEKIFDAMRCYTVPVYWGAPNVEDYVPAECFVDRRQFSSDRELGEHLIGMSEEEHAERVEAITRFLESERFRPFLPASFADAVMGPLGLAPNAEKSSKSKDGSRS